MISISVQETDFDNNKEYQALRKSSRHNGAIVTFTGLVREFDQGAGKRLVLEHYPGMTESALHAIAEKAEKRWAVTHIRIIHRVGSMDINEQIVFVGVAGAHRQATFAACEFIMDYLKTQAPFWKKAETSEGSYWIEAKLSDKHALNKWASNEQEKN